MDGIAQKGKGRIVMQNSNETKLGTQPIPKLIGSLALPAVMAQIINVLYNIVDRIYIGRMKEIGDIALTGVGVCFSILMIISAFAAFVGMGGAPLASIQLGKNDREGAEKILGNSVSLLVIISIILTVFFLIFKTPLLYAFGASDNTIVYAEEYLTIYLFGTIFVQAALGLNTFISAQGQAKVAMLSVLIGAIINIILDPILIYGLNMGVKGAATATVISQFFSAVWVVKFLASNKSSIRIKKQYLKFSKKTIASIAALGVSPFIMQSTESLVAIVLNSGLKHYGNDIYVGSMTIMMSVLQLIVMPVQGIVQGAQPIISYNYGAGNEERVKRTFRWLLGITVTVTVVACLITTQFPGVFVKMFNKKPELVEVTVEMMPIYLGGIWAFGAQMACQTTFMGLGQAKISLFLALLRKVILLIPLALILPRFFGVEGIYYSEPIADIIASAVTLTVFMLTYKKILSQTSDKKTL